MKKPCISAKLHEPTARTYTNLHTSARKMEPAITLAVLPGDSGGYGGGGGGGGGGALNESHSEPYDALLKIVLVLGFRV